MQFIPQYQPQAPRVQNQSAEILLNAIGQKKASMEKTNRLRNEAIKSSLDDLKISELVSEQNTKMANDAYDDIVNDLTNSMMYKTDPTGKQVRKESSFFGPSIDDVEFQNILKKISKADQLISKARAEEKQVKYWDDAIIEAEKKGDPNIDIQKSRERLQAYYESGKAPKSGNYMVFNGVDPNVWTSDTKLYQKNQEVRGLSADENYWVYADAPIEYKLAQYHTNMLDPRKQKGMAENMVGEMTSGTKLGEAGKQKLIASIMSHGVDAAKANEYAAEMINDLRNGDVHPILSETAIMWGEQDAKYHLNIAKGTSVRRATSEKGETSSTPRTPPERTYVAGDFRMDNFKDFGQLSSTERAVQTKLPKGTIKVVPGAGKKSATKSFAELNQSGTYYVDGYDEKAGWIAVRSAPVKTNGAITTPSYEFLVPYKGHEELIREQKNKLYGKQPETDAEVTTGYLD